MKRLLSIFSIALTCVIFLILSATSVQAAGERYWVGGTGNWSDDTNHWATSSGGSPGAGNLPTSSDDVFVDENSGLSGGTINIGEVNVECHDFTSTTGFSYTLQDTDQNHNYGLICFGSLTLESGFTYIASPIILASIDAGETLTFGGATITDGIRIVGVGTWELQDDMVISGRFYQENGTFDANDHNITANDFYFYADAGYTPTVIMGSGTWKITGGNWLVEENNGEVVTIVPEISTIKVDFGAYFYGNGKTYWNIWETVGANIVDSNTFNDMKLEPQANAYTFREGSTQTVTTFTATGSVGNLVILNTENATGQFTLSKSSGVVSSDYLDISNSNTAGGATWYAGSHSNDTNNNSGWIFEDAPTPMATPTQTSNPSVAGAVSDGLGCGSHDCSNITTSTTTRRSVSTANPTATGFQLFDIALTIDSAVLGKSSELIARTQFTSFGTVPTLVNMVYRIEDAGGNKVFSENDEVTVETEQLVTKDFKNLELKDGKYTLVLSTTYGNNVQDEFKQAFEVKGVATTKGISSNTIRIISIPIVAGLAVFGTFLYIKRKQKMSN